MDFVEYLTKIGDAQAARLFGVEKRTAKSWRLLERRPRAEQAQMIVKKSPVTYASIYGARPKKK